MFQTNHLIFEKTIFEKNPIIKTMKSILLTLFAIICSTAQAQNLNIIFKVNDKEIIREDKNLTGAKSLDSINL